MLLVSDFYLFFRASYLAFFWLFSAFIRSSIRLAFHRSVKRTFHRTFHRTYVALLIVVCESLNGLREFFVYCFLGMIK
jgi:hypothetical protein